MKQGHLVFFIFCTTLILECKGQANFDTVAFIQKWPVCPNKTSCPFNGKLFNLHTFFIYKVYTFSAYGDARFLTHAVAAFTKETGAISVDCRDVYFDLDPLVEIIDDLEFAWPDWPQDVDETVWEKDWRLHGSCFEEQNIQGLNQEGSFFKQGKTYFSTYLN